MMQTGCVDRASRATDSLESDSMEVADSIPLDSLSEMVAEMPMPTRADELFDDFIFNYAANIKVQEARTVFPVRYEEYGQEVVVSNRQEWVREGFFMAQGYYAIICSDKRQMTLMKDTAICQAEIQKISYNERTVKYWTFKRVNGKWLMTGIRVDDMENHPDHDFISFYCRFANDSVYQEQSLADYVTFKGPDPDDDFSTMEGEIMKEQWTMFRPWMPTKSFYSIVYGNGARRKSNERIFLIRGIANGLQTDLYFTRKNNAWQLVKVQN